MHGVAPRMCDQVVRPLSGRGAGGRSPGFRLKLVNGALLLRAVIPESKGAVQSQVRHQCCVLPPAKKPSSQSTLEIPTVLNFRYPMIV
jgi:hypothetical protein